MSATDTTMDPAIYAPVVYLGSTSDRLQAVRLPGGLTHSQALAAALAEAEHHPGCTSYGARREDTEPASYCRLHPGDRIKSLHAYRRGVVVRVYADGSACILWDDGTPQPEGLGHERMPRNLLMLDSPPDPSADTWHPCLFMMEEAVDGILVPTRKERLPGGLTRGEAWDLARKAMDTRPEVVGILVCRDREEGMTA